MSVLDIQRRGQQIGRLRIGEQVAILKDGKDTGKTRPARRETFRLTTTSRYTADAAAEYFGSEVKPWNGQWEVDTRRAEIAVMVPPRDAVVSQWYEMWNAGGCVRRCNSQRDQIGGGECQCPHAADPSDAEQAERAALRRAEMAKQGNACSLVTRVSVMIPDLPGLGVFRIDTHSFYAASEIGDTAHILEKARDKGVYLPALVRIDQRQRVSGGQTKRFPVLTLEITVTLRQITSGELAAGGVAAQLPPGPGEQRKAIAAGGAAPLPPSGTVVPGEIVDAEIVEEWLDTALADAVTLPDEDAGRALWREAAAKAGTGEIAGSDAGRIQALITARLADLKSEAALDPEDPWAVKVEGLASDLEAGDALGELCGLCEAGAVDPSRAARVRAAIRLRFPQAVAS